MKNATVAIEDKRFYQHHGVDFTGIARALVDDIKAGHVVQGASTITEQYVKNAYIGADPTLTRKLREAVLAWELEDRWSKDKILTEYLNTVYYGAGSYGVRRPRSPTSTSRSRRSRCRRRRCSPPCPSSPASTRRSPTPRSSRERRNLVLDDMAQQGYITPAQDAAAKATKLRVFAKPVSTTKDPAAYFVDYVTRKLVDRYGARETFEGGLRVYTSIDMRMQADAIAALKAKLPTTGQAGALVAIDPANGFIRAMAASTDYKTYKFNLAWQAHAPARLDHEALRPDRGGRAGRQPGDDLLQLAPAAHLPGSGRRAALLGRLHRRTVVGRTHEPGAGHPGSPTTRSSPSSASTSARTAIVRVAHQMGITTKLIAEPSIVLGSEDVNVLEMADAYATMASEGVHHAPQAIEKVVFPNGRVVKTQDQGKRVLSAGVAYIVDKILEQNTSYAGGTAALDAQLLRRPLGRQDRHHRQLRRRLVLRLQPQAGDGRLDGLPAGPRSRCRGVFGATYSLPIWGTFYNSVFGSTYIPDFATPAIMPLWKPWEGKYSKMAPSPSPSPSALAVGQHDAQADQVDARDDPDDAPPDAQADRPRRPARTSPKP